MSVLFLLSGLGKVTAVAATQAYMAAYGVPGLLLWPAAALEIGSGVLLLLGLGLRPLGLVLAGWCLLTALIFPHRLRGPEPGDQLLEEPGDGGRVPAARDAGCADLRPRWTTIVPP